MPVLVVYELKAACLAEDQSSLRRAGSHTMRPSSEFRRQEDEKGDGTCEETKSVIRVHHQDDRLMHPKVAD